MLTSPDQIAAFLIAVCFAAGLNVYGTVAALGLISRAGLVQLPGDLTVLQNPWVIGAALVLFTIEFIVDKVPVVDLVWNIIQTYVRVPVAGVLAYAALPTLDPTWHWAAGVAGALLALLAHAGKTTLRTAVSASPEPVTNIGLSLTEDVAMLTLVWFATQHPFVAAGLVVALVVGLVVITRWLLLGFRKLIGSRR